MKKIRDNNAFEEPLILLGSIVLALVLTVLFFSSVATYADGQWSDYDRGTVLILMALYTAVIALLFIGCVVPRLFGISITDGGRHWYADAYVCTVLPALTSQCSAYDSKKAQLKTSLYLQFTYDEISAFYKIMRRDGSGIFMLPAQYFPSPIGNSAKLKLSRRAAKRILREMRRGEYVVLRWDLKLDWLGEAVWYQDEYLSLRDIRRIKQCLNDKPNGVEVATIFQPANYRIDQVYLDNWVKRLNQENLYLSIHH